MNPVFLPTNLTLIIFANGYERIQEHKDDENFRKFIRSKFKGTYLIHKESANKRNEGVPLHYHIWFQDLNVKKKTFIDQFTKQFPYLKRSGQQGANFRSALSYTNKNKYSPENQFVYNFKNYDTPSPNTSEFESNMLLNNKTKKKYKEKYLKLIELNKLGQGGLFYKYCMEHCPAKLDDPSALVRHYLNWSIEKGSKRINFFDCQNNINYILARENPDYLEKIWINKLISQNNYLNI